MARNNRTREVSCLGLTFIYDYLEKHGIPRRRIQEGLPYPPEHLDNRLNWIDIRTMHAIEDRVSALFPDRPRIHVEIGRSVGDTGGFGFLRVMIRSVTSPIQVYNYLPMFVERFLFPICHPVFERVASNRLRATYRFDEGYPPSDAFLQTVEGLLIGIPTLMGAEEAKVAMERVSDLEARFDIRLKEWAGPTDRLKGFVQGALGLARMGLRNLPDAAAELEETNRLLLEKVDALTEAQDQLDRKVRDLSILNALTRTAASELDLRRLVGSSVTVMSDQLGEIPAAVFLRSADEDPWRCAGSTRVLPADLSVLEGAVRTWSRTLDPGTPASHTRMTTLLQWVVLPMRSKDRLVGVLTLATGDRADYDAALLEAIADALAVAVDNALSVQLIRELRDHLDLRVRERTAELEQARGQLEDTVARLERSDQARREFFTNVSHELKTPLTLILAPVDELETRLKPGGDETALATLRTIRTSAQSLLRLVNEILDFARLDEGRIPVAPEELELTRFVDEVVEYLKPLADRRTVSLTVQRPPRKVAVHVDAKLLRRALVNLVGNAIKYVDPGARVVVRLRVSRDRVVLEVEDNGPGIPAGEQRRIFERFQRVNDARGRVVEGSGIGLAMVKDIVTLHGGTVELDSEVGRGSTFRIRLPRSSEALPARQVSPSGKAPAQLSDVLLDVESAESPSADLPAAGPGSEAGREGLSGRVLLVEDNPQMRDFLATVLSRRHQVAVAEDGVVGLAKAHKELPDVIVSDVMMPRMDGFEMCRQLKADPATRNIPLVLLTARHGTDAVLEGFQAGADDFVVKPFSTPELMARIDAQLRIRSLTLSLLRSEQQASLGVVSAGIAHEVLNPVNAIVNSVNPLRKVIARMKKGGGSGDDAVICDALLRAVEQSGERIHRIVEAFRTVARPGEIGLDLQEVRPSEVIDAVLEMLQYRLGNDGRVRIHRRYGWDEPMLCYPDLLGQVVMNLVVNALDALGDDGGNLTLTSERVRGEVRLRVRDDGPGIPPEARQRVFTPFFTTKPPGSGTGLGLSISREIMSLHRGTLDLAPSGERGVEFVATLPFASPMGEEPSARAGAGAGARGTSR